MKQKLFLILVLMLCGCTKGQGISLIPYENPEAGPRGFDVCHGFSCTYKTPSYFTDAQWAGILQPLKTTAKDAQAERRNIARSIALMEKYATENAGLRPDLGKAETFEKDQHQMDCLDEAINTSHYLQMLEQAGGLHWNEVSDPIHRGFFVDGMWPHNSAAVKDKETGEVYAIDTYYFDSGVEPAVVPIDEWLDEWRPAE